jgi:catechol 2,3-dioxygenase-like lactoylglutathione lyase family enzyme
VLDHLSIECDDVDAAKAFYDAVLAPLGGGRIVEFGDVVGYGVRGKPDFWFGPNTTGGTNREHHGAFVRDPDGDNVEAVCHRPA